MKNDNVAIVRVDNQLRATLNRTHCQSNYNLILVLIRKWGETNVFQATGFVSEPHCKFRILVRRPFDSNDNDNGHILYGKTL